jgi:hypothetical protein
MHVFDNFERTDLKKASYSEALFPYLNRSALPMFSATRQVIEAWFSRYPKSHASELRARLRSNDNIDCESAIFELMMHELLIKLDCEVVVHPEISGISRSPDFLVSSHGDETFYLEATLATLKPDKEVASEAMINQVFDAINRQVDSTKFFLDVEIQGSPHTQPNARKISIGINEWLAKLDPDEIGQAFEDEGLDGIPEWSTSHDGWFIRIRPIPKKRSKREQPAKSAIGVVGTGVRFVDHRTPLRKTLESKSSAYGVLEHPYIIAVNVLEHIDDIDIMEALFGKETWTVSFGEGVENSLPPPEMSRIPDGLWTRYGGPTNTRVSAVLIFIRLKVWDLFGAKVRLYHNPWAKKPYSSALTRLPQSVPDKYRMVPIGGSSLHEIIG